MSTSSVSTPAGGAQLRCRVLRVYRYFPDRGTSYLQVEPLVAPPSPHEDLTRFGVNGPGKVAVGDEVEVIGAWVHDPRWGWQVKASAILPGVTFNATGLVAFLTRLPQIGQQRAEEIVRRYGTDETRRILDEEDASALRAIPGLTEERIADIFTAYQSERRLREAHVALGAWGLEPFLIAKALDKWAEDAPAGLQEDPYELTRLEGAGFLRADKLAGKMGIAFNDPRRCAAAAYSVLEASLSEGHVWSPVSLLTGEGKVSDWTVKAARATRLEPAELRQGVELLSQERVRGTRRFPPRVAWLDAARVAEAEHWTAEADIARHLRRLQQSLPPLGVGPGSADLSHLDPLQAEAVRLAGEHPVVILTGGPGTGKTTSTREILDLYAANKQNVTCVAPTGKAAIRMREQTGHEAGTIHRTLGRDPETGYWSHHERFPLQTHAVAVDETSMVSAKLLAALLAAIPDGGRLFIVGDPHQLPSIDPGRVLADLVESGRVPTVTLTRIFRQASESRIPYLARDIHEGRSPDLTSGGGLTFVPVDEPDQVADRLVQAMVEGPGSWGVDRAQVQILSPQKTGPLGTAMLNRRVQERLQPHRSESEGVILGGGDGDLAFIGDRVIQTRNNYDLGDGVMNGEIGVVEAVDPDENPSLVVSFPGRQVSYSPADVKQLQLAYATTIHRYQGSSAPVILMPVHSTHTFMLSRSLLYTAVTRAERAVVLFGEAEAVARAAVNTRGSQRRTTLLEQLGCVSPAEGAA